MCGVCGCGGDEARLETGAAGAKAHHHHHDHDHEHDHEHGHAHHHHHHHHHGHGHGPDGALDFSAASAPIEGRGEPRLIAMEQDILAKNDALAAVNRTRLADARVATLNLMSSPGSGKTTLLVETLKALAGATPAAVIEGDQQTSNDAARIRAAGVDAIQVNTGKGCHLDAQMVGAALDHIHAPAGGFLFIENVGNLVCPAGFDLGEDWRVVMVSVTEGEDKPLKYPEMFAGADVVVVTKTDLLPHLAFDLDALIANVHKIRPQAEVVLASATAPGGLKAWLAWLERRRPALRDAAE